MANERRQSKIHSMITGKDDREKLLKDTEIKPRTFSTK